MPLKLGVYSVDGRINLPKGCFTSSSSELRLLVLLLAQLLSRNTNDGSLELLYTFGLLLGSIVNLILLVQTAPSSGPVDHGRLLSQVVQSPALLVNESHRL